MNNFKPKNDMIQICILKIAPTRIWKRDKWRKDKDRPVKWLI